ncbi:MAG: hypothetical protein HFG15_03515 [Bacilli bacterium]|jgi:hypothetical protein|nr:hypothetical protein [Bacilli bacterium]
MNKIEFGDLITLEDGKEYICFGLIEDHYVCLIRNIKNEKKDYLFAKQIIANGDLSLEIVEDEKTLNRLNDLFLKKYKGE